MLGGFSWLCCTGFDDVEEQRYSCLLAAHPAELPSVVGSWKERSRVMAEYGGASFEQRQLKLNRQVSCDLLYNIAEGKLLISSLPQRELMAKKQKQRQVQSGICVA